MSDNVDNWAALYDQSEVSQVNDSLLNKLLSVDIRYLNLNIAGQGAVKKIIRTEDRMTGRVIAKAVLINNTDERMVESFIREARITAHLQHPNIVPVYDIGIDEGYKPYFTMKLIRGYSLAEILDELAAGNEDFLEAYPLPKLIDIFLKISEAMAYAHSEGVIHLDLKPDNVRVSRFGEVAVCDWGLANLMDRDDEDEDDEASADLFTSRYRTMTGQIKGTPGYMAPEQARGQGEPKDERTDIYSLGCILYQILTHRLAIKGNNLERILKNTCTGNITPPSKRRPDLVLPASLEAVCMKALSLYPEDRYQYVEDITSDIQAYREGFATEAEEVSLTKQLKLFYLRHRNFSLTVGLLLFILAVLTGYFISNIKEETRKTQYALDNLKKEQEIKETIGKEGAAIFAMRAEKAYLNSDLEEAEKLADLTLRLEPNHLKALEYKGKLSFVRQNFGDAYKCFKRVKRGDFKDLIKFCETMAENKLKPPVSLQKIYPYMKSIRTNRYALISQLLSYTVFSSPDPEKALKWLLEKKSGLPAAVSLNKTAKGWALDLSGYTGLSNISFLSHFPFHHINFQKSTVNFADSKLEGFVNLKSFEISKGKHNVKILAVLKRKFKLIEK